MYHSLKNSQEFRESPDPNEGWHCAIGTKAGMDWSASKLWLILLHTCNPENKKNMPLKHNNNSPVKCTFVILLNPQWMTLFDGRQDSAKNQFHHLDLRSVFVALIGMIMKPKPFPVGLTSFSQLNRVTLFLPSWAGRRKSMALLCFPKHCRAPSSSPGRPTSWQTGQIPSKHQTKSLETSINTNTIHFMRCFWTED